MQGDPDPEDSPSPIQALGLAPHTVVTRMEVLCLSALAAVQFLHLEIGKLQQVHTVLEDVPIPEAMTSCMLLHLSVGVGYRGVPKT